MWLLDDSHSIGCFYGAEQVWQGEDCGRVGITRSGNLQPEYMQTKLVLSRLKETIGEIPKMKQICHLTIRYLSSGGYQDYIGEDSFLGVDTTGKIVVYNPFEVFGYSPKYQSDIEMCGDLMQTIKKLPKIHKVYPYKNSFFAITETGKVFLVGQTASGSAVEKRIQEWENIESILGWKWKSNDYLVGLKNDGSLVAVAQDSTQKNEQTFSEAWNIPLCNIVQIKEISHNVYAFLYQNGDMLVPQHKCLVKNVISLVNGGYIGLGGFLWLWEQNRFQNTEKEMFGSIETLHEEWEARHEKKINLKKEYQECNDKYSRLEKEQGALHEQLKKLGLFQFKARGELKQNIQGIAEEQERLKAKLTDLEYEVKFYYTPSCRSIYSKKNNLSSCRTVTKADLDEIRSNIDNQLNPQKKDKSVVGSAVVGGLVAGPAGAVVGAVYAADKNRKNNTSQVNSSGKDKSVVGSAVVGGLVAGPAGAVVGAVYAADKNNKNKK